MVPSFALQIARIEAGQQPPIIRVGNLDVERDFLDVRDVTEAYALTLAKSADLPSGTILNIASGVPRVIRDLLDRLLGLVCAHYGRCGPERMWPSDTPRFVGDAAGAAAARLVAEASIRHHARRRAHLLPRR